MCNSNRTVFYDLYDIWYWRWKRLYLQNISLFWPRAMLKEAFLLLFLRLAGNHVQKMFQMEQKLRKGTKNVHKGFCGTLWYWMAVYALYGLFYLIWRHIVLHGLFLWSFMVKYWFYWTCIVFSRGHRSKFIWSCLFQLLTLKSWYWRR